MRLRELSLSLTEKCLPASVKANSNQGNLLEQGEAIERLTMNTPMASSKSPHVFNPKEYKVVTLRECPVPEEMHLCDQPVLASEYWRRHITAHPSFNQDVECFVALLLNTRRRIKGHALIATGILDSILVHPREVFRPAIISASSAILVMHNHPSGDPAPSEADIRVTRDLIRAGKLLKIEVIDHVIVGAPNRFSSLSEMGYFYE